MIVKKGETGGQRDAREVRQMRRRENKRGGN